MASSNISLGDGAPDNTTVDPDWKRLYFVGGVSALVAALLFRRNIAAEVSLFATIQPPASIEEWYALLQDNRLLGLAYLNFFDLLNYTLLALMFIAVFMSLRRVERSLTLIAVTLALIGITVYYVANPALTMLALSDQFASATLESQRVTLLAAGQGSMATGRFTGAGVLPGSGGYASLFLVALGGAITSAVMLRSRLYGRFTPYAGLAASTLDLTYCLLILLMPSPYLDLLGLALIPLAGLLWMVWHLLVGLKLLKFSRR